MTDKERRCVILAGRHHGLTEGVRGLLKTMFDTLVMVANEGSLLESAARLKPTAVIADISLARTESLDWLKELRNSCPEAKLVVLSVHDEPSVCGKTLEAGADGFILKKSIATDLLSALDAVMEGRQYVSPNLRRTAPWEGRRPTVAFLGGRISMRGSPHKKRS